MASAYNDTVKVFKAFCDENRLRILEMLRTGEKCACKLLDDLQITQSTLSHHMKILCDAGIVQGRKDGKWVYYSIDPKGADHARKLLEQQLSLEASNGENRKEILIYGSITFNLAFHPGSGAWNEMAQCGYRKRPFGCRAGHINKVGR